MKKLLFIIPCALLLLASCDMKKCYCYEPINGLMTVDETYTDINSQCSSLSTTRRICVEEQEYVDPNSMAVDFKK